MRVVRFGPYSPQELDALIPKLESLGLVFELFFDKEGERRDLAFTPENMLALAEFRTKTYLAQHFYLTVELLELARVKGARGVLERGMNKDVSFFEVEPVARGTAKEMSELQHAAVADLQGRGSRPTRPHMRWRLFLAVAGLFLAVLFFLIFGG